MKVAPFLCLCGSLTYQVMAGFAMRTQLLRWRIAAGLLFCTMSGTAQDANSQNENDSKPVTKTFATSGLLKCHSENSQETEKNEAKVGREEEEAEGYFPEIEFVASNKFRSLSYMHPVLSQVLDFEAHHFGISRDRRWHGEW